MKSSVIKHYISKEHNYKDTAFQIDDQEDALTEKELYNKRKSLFLTIADKPIAWQWKNLSDLGTSNVPRKNQKYSLFWKRKKFPYNIQ